MAKPPVQLGDISDRHRDILCAVIDNFVATAAPVGSRTISKASKCDLSPATIRNVMSDLEDLGLLQQPHASAGRVPTVSALRYWIDRWVVPRDPGQRQRRLLQTSVAEAHGPKDMLERVAGVLSVLSGGVGVALAPGLDKGRLERAELVALGDSRLLLLWVTRQGSVYHREIILPQSILAEDVSQLERLLNADYRGATFDEVRLRLREDLRDMRQRLGALVEQLFTVAGISDSDLIVEGVKRVVEQPDFANVDLLRRLYEAFADRHTLGAILDRIARHGGLQVLLNDETGLGGAGLSLVAGAYGSTQGSIGVFGPARMAYPEILGLVRYATDLLDRSLGAEL